MPSHSKLTRDTLCIEEIYEDLFSHTRDYELFTAEEQKHCHNKLFDTLHTWSCNMIKAALSRNYDTNIHKETVATTLYYSN